MWGKPASDKDQHRFLRYYYYLMYCAESRWAKVLYDYTGNTDTQHKETNLKYQGAKTQPILHLKHTVIRWQTWKTPNSVEGICPT